MNARDPKLPLQPDEATALAAYAERSWDEQIVPAMTDYIAIPAKSPMFDADWQAHGHLERVVRDTAAWIEGRKLPGLKLQVLRQPGRTPLIFFEVPATRAQGAPTTVVFYGHLDKQPEFNGWRHDLGPWTPKYENGRLYGRGGADDGYAAYAAITAIEALDAQGIAAAALRGPDRDLRGKRLGRPAGLPGRAARADWARWHWWYAWTAAPAATTSCG